MKSLALCQELCPELIPVEPLLQIGDGADGEVFTIKNSSDKVIKFSIIYEYSVPIEQDLERISKVLELLQETIPSACARVFDFKKLTGSYRNTVSGPQQYFLYYYIMEKCQKISDDEKKVFHTIISHEDRGINKNYSDFELRKVLKGLSIGLDFNLDKVMSFYKSIINCPIIHSDTHPRNIMKDQLGNFKLIDFDRSVLK